MGLGDSLEISATGLRAVDLGIQVVGNNVANINSTAFKSSQVLFANLFYDTIQGGRPASQNDPGKNTVQAGNGVTVSSISPDLSQGPITGTGVAENMYVFGSGYFIVRQGSSRLYTRDGSFTLDANANLTTAQGLPVQGYSVDDEFNLVTTSIGDLSIPIGQREFGLPTSRALWGGTVNPSGAIASQATIRRSAPTSATSLGDAVGQVTVGGRPVINDGSGGFNEAVTIAYRPQRASGALATASITLAPTDPLSKLTDFLASSLEINTGLTQPAGNAPGASVAVDGSLQMTGNLGRTSNFTIGQQDFVVTRVSDGRLGSTNLQFDRELQVADGESVSANSLIYDSDGNPVILDATIYLESVDTSATTWRVLYASPDNDTGATSTRILGDTVLTFDNFGRLVGNSRPDLSVNLNDRTATDPLVFTNDFSRLFALSRPTSVFNLQSQNGLERGTLIEFEVNEDGRIVGIFDNGGNRDLGQILLAQFSNPTGLVNLQQGLYAQGLASGDPNIVEPNTSAGRVGNRAIEASNVDLGDSLVQLVGLSVAFNANSRSFGTAQELISSFNQLIRQL
jgi:flagellar hook protein FlgE